MLTDVSFTEIPNTPKHKILFPAYVCYFSATVIVFKTFFISYLTQSGFGKQITTQNGGLDGKVLPAQFQNTKILLITLDRKKIHLRFSKLRKTLYVDLVKRTK
jgi:hypothetical protein